MNSIASISYPSNVTEAVTLSSFKSNSLLDITAVVNVVAL